MNYPTAIVAAGGLALALVAVPVHFESGDLMPSKSIALADKGGNSGDHSNAGGGGGNGPSTGGGWAFGAGGHTSPNANHNPNIASKLKGLNAAHANQKAFDNAALSSRVGLLAVYLGIATTQDLAALTALRDAAQAALDAAGGDIPGNESLVAALAAAQADLDAALALEANALFDAAKGNDIDTTDPEVIDRVRVLLGLPPI